MILLFLETVLIGIALIGWSVLLTEYDGPFNLLAWFRESLLPGNKPVWPKQPEDIKDTVLMQKWTFEIQNYKEKVDNWLHFVDYPTFPLTLKGTIYNIFSCKFCILPYLSILFVSILFIPKVFDIQKFKILIDFLLMINSSIGIGVLVNKCLK